MAALLSSSCTQTSGRIQQKDPPEGSVIYTIGELESRIGDSTFWIVPKLWVGIVAMQPEEEPAFLLLGLRLANTLLSCGQDFW